VASAAVSSATSTAYEAALKALVTYIVEIVNSTSKMRFHEAMKLCGMAQTLEQMKAERIADYGMMPQDQIGGYGVYDNFGVAPMRIRQVGMVNFAGPLDQNEVVRNLAQTLGPNLQVQTESAKSLMAKNEAEEMESLSRMLAATVEVDRRAIIDERIKKLFTNLETRNHVQEPAPEPAVNGVNGVNGIVGAAHAAVPVAPGFELVPAVVPR
jgi:hypothetical protein